MLSNIPLTVLLPVSFLVLGILRLVSSIVYNIYFHPLCSYPGPKLYAATRLAHSRTVLSGKAHKIITELHKQYGPVVRLGPNTIGWADPRAFKDLVGHRKGKVENYRDPVKATSKPNGIIYASTENHARIRQVLSPGFSTQSMLEQQPLVQKHIDLLIQRLYENCKDGALDMVAWYNFTGFDIIGDLAFGEPFGCLEKSDYHFWVSSFFDNLHAIVIGHELKRFWVTRQLTTWLVPAKLKKKAQIFKQLSLDKVHRRMASGESRPDFIQTMTMKEGAMSMSKSEIEETADTLIIGGAETTATVLSGATFFLTTHPDAMAKLVEEVRSSFRSEQEIDLLSVQKLPYMLAVINETMRLYPVLPTGINRTIKPGGDYICERYVPEGTEVILSQWPFQHSDEYFAQPDAFIPERFLDDPRFVNDNKSALMPFGIGPRNCIARNLAMCQLRLILARVLWNFDLQIEDESRSWMEIQKLYTLWKKGHLNVRLTPRNTC
ncbi:cytochrome P450 [Colletotrichum zoysiae]|uniref:Cytochrome P450 n=1 Tax=Colletotrichum zoysiae TaxID=1216348 RepID=A0AAD9HS31_9PEZI|nr:cytochrome P450 [Colletotrichum zoysiae]